MITLRPEYQLPLIEKTRKALLQGHTRIAIDLPTGGGKTVIFSFIAQGFDTKNKKVLILTHRTELLFETGGTLGDFDMKVGYITAGQLMPPTNHNVNVAMAKTLINRIHKKNWQKYFSSLSAIIIDEAHLQDFNDFFIENVFRKDQLIFSFSATFSRSGKQRQLHLDYTKLIKGPSVKQLIKLGYLMPDRYFGIEGVSMKGVSKNSKGDYSEAQMYERFNKKELYDGAIEAWLQNTPNTITLGFCSSIKHVIETTKRFNEAGIKAKFVVSDVAKPKLKANPSEADRIKYDIKVGEYYNFLNAYKKYSGGRKSIINQWMKGDYYVLFNAGILTTGFNFKPIETILMNRKTLSQNLLDQMFGRGSRPSPKTGKTHFNIIDMGNHIEDMLMYQMPRAHSLHHEEKDGGGVAPVRECGKQHRADERPDPETGYTKDKNGKLGCGFWMATANNVCPFCGYLFETEKELVKVELKLIDYADVDIDIEEDKEDDVFKRLEREQEERGYKAGWILNKIILEEGKEGLKKYAKFKNYNNSWLHLTANRYKNQINSFDLKQLNKTNK